MNWQRVGRLWDDAIMWLLVLCLVIIMWAIVGCLVALVIWEWRVLL